MTGPSTDGLSPEVVNSIVDPAAPSAGSIQGWHLIVLEGAETTRFWDITLPPMRRRLAGSDCSTLR